MKIGVTSDLHGILPKIEPCDLLLICGDIMPLKMQRNIPQSEKWLKTEFADWVNNLACGNVVMVGGNHDFALANMWKNTLKQKEVLYKPTNSKLVYLENEPYRFNFIDEGETILIWGTPFCQIFGNWAFMHENEILTEAYSTMPEHCDIVLTHDAPKLCGLGKIHQSRFPEDVGNRWLADEMLRKHPRYTFCGHVHSGEHELQTLDDMKMANVSLVDEQYEQAFNILYLDI